MEKHEWQLLHILQQLNKYGPLTFERIRAVTILFQNMGKSIVFNFFHSPIDGMVSEDFDKTIAKMIDCGHLVPVEDKTGYYSCTGNVDPQYQSSIGEYAQVLMSYHPFVIYLAARYHIRRHMGYKHKDSIEFIMNDRCGYMYEPIDGDVEAVIKLVRTLNLYDEQMEVLTLS